MKVSILGDRATAAYNAALEVCELLGMPVADSSTDVAIAPLLTYKLSDSDIASYKYGVLVFHPSPLPYGRGKAAIRHAYKRREPITAATWFCANSEYDAGDICEQEIMRIDYSLSPREFYERHVLPAMRRTLRRALEGTAGGTPRRVPQLHEYSTYD